MVKCNKSSCMFLHVNAWSILYFAFQTHSCGKRLSSHPYLNKTASHNSRLVNENLSYFYGKDDNHIEALCSFAPSLAFNYAGVILLQMLLGRSS